MPQGYGRKKVEERTGRWSSGPINRDPASPAVAPEVIAVLSTGYIHPTGIL